MKERADLRTLFGPDPRTAGWIGLLVVAQIAIAMAVRHRSPLAVMVLVLLVGAPIAHAIGVLIHECAHNLVFRATPLNKLFALVANLGLGLPGAMTFRHRHLLHHGYLGDTREPDGRDTQAPTRAEIRLGAGSALAKLVAFSVGHIVFATRGSDAPPRDRWWFANVVTSGSALALLAWFGGIRSVIYVLLSLFFAFGPHPLGGRRVSEHLTLRRGQPTVSYYGVANTIAFNVGFHVEHHDFPRVPWSRLPALRRAVPGYYEPLAFVRSWTGLLVAHILDRRQHRGLYVGATEEMVESFSGTSWASGLARGSASGAGTLR